MSFSLRNNCAGFFFRTIDSLPKKMAKIAQDLMVISCNKIHYFYFCFTFTFTFTFSRRFYPKRLTVHSGYTCFITMCVPWESNPQPFALLTQCSTTEPQEHRMLSMPLYRTSGLENVTVEINADKVIYIVNV